MSLNEKYTQNYSDRPKTYPNNDKYKYKKKLNETDQVKRTDKWFSKNNQIMIDGSTFDEVEALKFKIKTLEWQIRLLNQINNARK